MPLLDGERGIPRNYGAGIGNRYSQSANFTKWACKHDFDITIDKEFEDSYNFWFIDIYHASYSYGKRLSETLEKSISESFKLVFPQILIRKDYTGLSAGQYCHDNGGAGACVTSPNINVWGFALTKSPEGELERIIHIEHELTHILGWELLNKGITNNPYGNPVLINSLPAYEGWPDPHQIWIQNSSQSHKEVFANMGPLWVHSEYENSSEGFLVKMFMEHNMPLWIRELTNGR